MTISIHAKERAFERYGVRFSKKRWESFERTIRNKKYAIRLHGERLACYFEKRWFLIICRENGAVLTFLSLKDANDEDRQLLKGDERYIQINDDTFSVLERNSTLSVKTQDIRLVDRSVDLPSTMLPGDELPQGVLETAENLMKKLCCEKTASKKTL